MSFIVLDFETYYDSEYSLKKLTTEEYVNDSRFQVIGVGVKVDDADPVWITDGVEEYLKSLDWADSALLAHNTLFDGAILAWRYGIVPAYYYDTLSMARAKLGQLQSVSLAALASRFNIGVKGEAVNQAMGKRRDSFTAGDLTAYGHYCCNDVVLTHDLFRCLFPFPQDELDLIDLTMRMYMQPQFKVDTLLLQSRLREIWIEKQAMLGSLMTQLNCADEEAVRKKLASNPQFAKCLEDLGVEVPMKISPRTGKDAYAFAKTDEGFVALQSHDDLAVQQLCAVRLGTKSTIEESRITRFIEIASRNGSGLPIPLRYYGAHTGRWAGTDSVNFQNLPSRDKAKKSLKSSLIAPPGYVVINADSSQIEARILAWWAGQEDLVEAFRQGRDVYSEFATMQYGRLITKADAVERFLGKTCLAEGTLVLCERGWIPIESVSVTDRVWDGEEWVCHQGSVLNGLKETLPISGLWLTPDHNVWSGTAWLPSELLEDDEKILCLALASAAEKLPLQAIYVDPEVLTRSSLNVTAGDLSTLLLTIILKRSNQRAVTYALNKLRQRKGIGFIQRLCLTMFTGHVYLTDWQRRLLDAIHRHVEFMKATVEEALRFINHGVKIALSFLDIFKLSPVGITQNSTWIEQTITRDTNRGILGLCLKAKTCGTKEKSTFLRKKLHVYDLLSAGPRNRFTVLTERGPLIVHNCILGLGYGTGAEKLRKTLKQGGVDFDLETCKGIVNLYRRTYTKIPELWHDSDLILRSMWRVNDYELPNGLNMHYPNLRMNNGKMIYDTFKGPKNIWGGAFVENITQALARIVIGFQMIEISRQGYRPALTVHDSLVYVVPENRVETVVKLVNEVMRTPPGWAEGLPLSCEVKTGVNYGEV